jgi:hypothetical protein
VWQKLSVFVRTRITWQSSVTELILGYWIDQCRLSKECDHQLSPPHFYSFLSLCKVFFSRVRVLKQHTVYSLQGFSSPQTSMSFCNPHSATVINALGCKADRSFCNLHSSPVHHLAHNAQRNCDHGTSLNLILSTQNPKMWFFVSQLQVCLSTSWKESPLRVQILSWSSLTVIVIASLKFVSSIHGIPPAD